MTQEEKESSHTEHDTTEGRWGSVLVGTSWKSCRQCPSVLAPKKQEHWFICCLFHLPLISEPDSLARKSLWLFEVRNY